MSDKPKSCFVVGPIGKPGSTDRENADWLFDHIVLPVASAQPFCMEVHRADHGFEPGQITTQIISALQNAAVVVADLTGKNPNAFYELAYSHAIGKPVVHVAMEGTELPFDVASLRTIFWEVTPIGIKKACADFQKQLASALGSSHRVDNPIVTAVGIIALSKSDAASDRLLAEMIDGQHRMMSVVEAISARVASLENTRNPRDPLGMLGEAKLSAEAILKGLVGASGNPESGQVSMGKPRRRGLGSLYEPQSIQCPACGGSGRSDVGLASDPCITCEGHGIVRIDGKSGG